MTTATDCPCGSGKPFASCCEPYLSGKAAAPTAEALMRARYTSYATGRVDFIEETHAPESRADFDRQASEKWAKGSQWKGLQILAIKDGGEADREGIVSFVARFAQGGRDYEHREIASFRKEDGRWLFVDGKSPKPDTFVKSGPELGRNDPCSCGSGKKFKKCHGK
ncbi:MAG: YchJ family protein [Elusimicrobia bacterium]|nr:YchJ family protein [Elusimicrobiota bacterium]